MGGILQGENTNADDNQTAVKANDDGQMSIMLGGAVVGADGVLKSIILDPDAANAADADTERYNNSTGCKGFRVAPNAGGVASVTAIIFAWSTTVADLTALNVTLAALASQFATPSTGGNKLSNTGILIPTEPGAWTTHAMWYNDTDWLFWDGTTRIKSIAVRSVGADYTPGVILQIIE